MHVRNCAQAEFQSVQHLQSSLRENEEACQFLRSFAAFAHTGSNEKTRVEPRVFHFIKRLADIGHDVDHLAGA